MIEYVRTVVKNLFVYFNPTVLRMYAMHVICKLANLNTYFHCIIWILLFSMYMSHLKLCVFKASSWTIGGSTLIVVKFLNHFVFICVSIYIALPCISGVATLMVTYLVLRQQIILYVLLDLRVSHYCDS